MDLEFFIIIFECNELCLCNFWRSSTNFLSHFRESSGKKSCQITFRESEIAK